MHCLAYASHPHYFASSFCDYFFWYSVCIYASSADVCAICLPHRRILIIYCYNVTSACRHILIICCCNVMPASTISSSATSDTAMPTARIPITCALTIDTLAASRAHGLCHCNRTQYRMDFAPVIRHNLLPPPPSLSLSLSLELIPPRPPPSLSLSAAYYHTRSPFLV